MTLPSLTAPPGDELRLVLCGPAYGESVLFGTAASGWIVVDSLAADDRDGSTVNPALKMLTDADARWSMLMLTHPHEDHVAGMAELVGQPEPGILACVERFVPVPHRWELDPRTGEDPREAEVLGPKERALTALRGVWDALPPTRRWDQRAGQCLMLGDVHLLCLWLTQAAVDSFGPGGDPNTVSTSLLVTWGRHRLLLGADILAGQWAEIAAAVGPEELATHGLLKVPHHGAKGARIAALDGTEADRTWIITPWDRGRTLPRFEDGQGISTLHQQHPAIDLTALPFRHATSGGQPFLYTREEVLELRERARRPATRNVARNLPRPVHDGWLDLIFRADGSIAARAGVAAGRVVAKASTADPAAPAPSPRRPAGSSPE